jgi:hypothetical protein
MPVAQAVLLCRFGATQAGRVVPATSYLADGRSQLAPDCNKIHIRDSLVEQARCDLRGLRKALVPLESAIAQTALFGDVVERD